MIALARPQRQAGFCQGGGFALIAGTQPGFSAAAVNYGDVPVDSSRLDGLSVSGVSCSLCTDP